jgi:hypothetical protein
VTGRRRFGGALDAGPVTAPDAARRARTRVRPPGRRRRDARRLCADLRWSLAATTPAAGTCSGAACAMGASAIRGRAACLSATARAAWTAAAGRSPCEGGHCVDNVCCSLTEPIAATGRTRTATGRWTATTGRRVLGHLQRRAELCSGSFCTAIGQMAMGTPSPRRGVRRRDPPVRRRTACCRDWHGGSLSSSGFATCSSWATTPGPSGHHRSSAVGGLAGNRGRTSRRWGPPTRSTRSGGKTKAISGRWEKWAPSVAASVETGQRRPAARTRR